MNNRYFLITGNHNDDRYSFIELYDKEDHTYYRLDHGKIEKDFLLNFDHPFFENKIPITEEKFNWILEQKFLFRNVDKEYLLKSLDLNEWII
jgi:hypothetical protein